MPKIISSEGLLAQARDIVANPKPDTPLFLRQSAWETLKEARGQKVNFDRLDAEAVALDTLRATPAPARPEPTTGTPPGARPARQPRNALLQELADGTPRRSARIATHCARHNIPHFGRVNGPTDDDAA